MNCIECKAPNPDESRYCGKCGALIGRSLEETIHKKFRDRKAIEAEITESVAKRLMTWVGWVRSTVALVLALFVLLVGLSLLDWRKDVESAKAQIVLLLRDANNDVQSLKQDTTALEQEVGQVRADTEGYKQTNDKIAKMQKLMLDVKDEVLDLRNKSLKVKALTVTGEGLHSGLLWGNPGCDPLQAGYPFGICAQGSPLVLTQVSASGESAPVASVSPIGFRDSSTGAKPNCDANKRGTFYAEKGARDEPWLCVQTSSGRYDWVELAIRTP